MGKNRNIPPEKQPDRERYTDSDVSLLGLSLLSGRHLSPRFVPEFEVRSQTVGLISCNKRHDDYFRLQFEKENDLHKLLCEEKYIEETMKVYEAQIAIVDNKVKKTQINQDVTLYKGEIPQEFQEK